MRLSINLSVGLTAIALLACQASTLAHAQGLDRSRYSIIVEPRDQRPRAITRPANAADRAWRKTRRSPEFKTAPLAPETRRFMAPRYDAYGRRRNVPGRPDTLDQFGRAGFDRPRTTIAPSGPTVRTDATTRINQLAPRR